MQYYKAELDVINILDALISSSNIKKMRNTIIKGLKNRIELDKITNVFNNNYPIKLLREYEKYFLLKNISSILIKNNKEIDCEFNINELAVEKYYTDIEIRDFESLPLLTKENEYDEIVLENVYVTMDNIQWSIPSIEGRTFLNLLYQNFVTYDKDMQRETEKVHWRDFEFERAKVYQKSVDEICEKMLNGTYTPDDLSINILKEDIEEILYDSENHTMTITKKTKNSLIDGMHRTLGMMKAYQIDPNLTIIMKLNIFYKDKLEARDYIAQQAKKNTMNKDLVKFYESTNVYNILVDDICKIGNKSNNLIKNILGTEKKDVEILNKFTTYTKLSEALETNFKLTNNQFKERKILAKYIVNFMNEIISYYATDFENIEESRKNSLCTYPNAIWLYIYIAKELENMEDWEDVLEKILPEIDLKVDGNYSDLKNFNLPKKYLKQIKDNVKSLIK